MKIMRTLKHLPLNEWPEADREVFRVVYEPGDVFDDTAGPGHPQAGPLGEPHRTHMPIPAARGGPVNDAGTLTMVVLPAQAPRLAAAFQPVLAARLARANVGGPACLAGVYQTAHPGYQEP